MSVKFTNGIDLDQTSLIQAVMHPVTSDPSSPVDGQIWYRTDTDTLHVRVDGTTESVAFSSGSGVQGSTWGAQSVVTAVTAGNPVSTALTAGQVLGRTEAGGNIGALSASDLIDILETADGTGSGLDADLLDGVEGASYALQSYVDAATQGLSPKDSVLAATTASITLSGAQTIDGVSVTTGDRVLVKDQSTASENGIYEANTSTWTRAADADSGDDILGAMCFVQEGTTNADTAWLCTTDAAITIGTTSLTFTQFGAGATYTAGSGLTLSANQFSIAADAITDSMLASGGAFVKAYTADIGDGSTNPVPVVHNLGTKDVSVTLRQNSDDEHVIPDIVSTSTTTVTLDFATTPTSSQYRVLVMGPSES